VTPDAIELSVRRRIRLLVRIWLTWVEVAVLLRRHPLPEVVSALNRGRPGPDMPREPLEMGRFIWRRLRLGPWRPRCLPRALVLLRLLDRSLSAQLVIGLPRHKSGKDAHAWVEVDGNDVGPPPGGRGHEELVRYGGD